MNKKILLCLLLLFAYININANENTLKFGIGIEANMNAFENFAFGRSVSLETQFFKHIVNGFAIAVSDDFNKLTVFQMEIFARSYFLEFDFSNLTKGGFFLQGDLGMSFFLKRTDSSPKVLAGLTTGFRYYFNRRDYFIEPYIKGGYPFVFAFGLRTGCRL